jgi:hypothetical protein
MEGDGEACEDDNSLDGGADTLDDGSAIEELMERMSEGSKGLVEGE